MRLADIVDELAAQIRSQMDRPTNVYVFDPGETRQYPCVIIEPGEPFVEYHTTFGNALCEVQLEVTVMVSARTIDSQVAIYDYCGDGTDSPSSIRRAIELGRNHTTGGLNGVIDDLAVYRVHKPTIDGDSGALTARFDVTAHVRRGSAD